MTCQTPACNRDAEPRLALCLQHLEALLHAAFGRRR